MIDAMDYVHLNALELRLHRERGYLSVAKTEGEKALRSVWIAQIEKEIKAEREFLGLPAVAVESELSDDDLARELLG